MGHRCVSLEAQSYQSLCQDGERREDQEKLEAECFLLHQNEVQCISNVTRLKRP